MSNSEVPRLVRRARPKQQFARTKYRNALPLLLEEFEGRCVYSGQHWKRAGGIKCLEVDHYDPRLKKRPKQDYYNLLLATRHCNGAKGEFWPTPSELAQGLYVINPCRETDYGHHVFEDPRHHRLWGATPTGIWHIRRLDLNAPHLVCERRDRAEIWRLLRQQYGVALRPGVSLNQFSQEMMPLWEVLQAMIPEWPAKEAPPAYRFVA